MADTHQFLTWYNHTMSNRARAETMAQERYQDVCESTGGWASAIKCWVLHVALISMNDSEEYLEIGSYVGRSIVGALKHNDKRAQVIDPFELFLPDGLAIYGAWERTVQAHNVADRITLHKALCQEFNGSLPPIGVFYYDGDHDSGHTYEGLKKFERCLSKQAIIIVDDYNIFGGHGQRAYPGHEVVIDKPVKVDVDRWLQETPHAKLIDIMPWENQSAVIHYEAPANTIN